MDPRVCVLCAALLQFYHYLNAFNVDTESPYFFTGPRGSYFGFSIALLVNSTGKWVVVGSPRAQSDHLPSVNHSGAVYKCLPDHTGNCEQMPLDTTGNSHGNNRRVGYYKDIKDHQLLGFNLAVSDGEDPRLALVHAERTRREKKIVDNIWACAPLWKNSKHPPHYATQGLCYEMVHGHVHMRRPLLYGALQIRNNGYFYIYGQAGFCTTYAKGKKNEKSKLVGGAPSLNNNNDLTDKGEIPVQITDDNSMANRDATRSIAKSSALNVRRSDSYRGFVAFDVDVGYVKEAFSRRSSRYSIASGNIFGQSKVSYVIGVPKSYPNGGVAIVNNNRYKLLQFIKGEQFNSYFGASVCTMDFNGDGFDDVVVGAPLFTNLHKVNAGKVYVFLTNKGQRKVLPDLIETFDVTLEGSVDSNAMFGQALADIGDINRDGTSDLAVGAPYEDDWRGAIYIYNGGRRGSSVQSQKIKGRSLNPGLRTFGWSISNGRDMDNNGYPDFAVGSYFSDHAVLLRSRPVVRIDAELRVDPNQIDTKLPRPISLNVTLCLMYKGQDLPQSLGVNYTLYSDTTRRSVRKFVRARFQQSLSVEVSATTTLDSGIKSCQNVPVQVTPDRELLSPIQFEADIELAAIKGNNSDSPPEILDPSQVTHLSTQASFQNKCGNDSRCVADLRIALNRTKFEGSDQLIIGQTTAVWIQMIINNLGEEAYKATLSVYIPERVEYAGLKSRTDKRITCVPVNSRGQLKNNLVHCDIGNPFDERSEIVLDMKLDVSKSTADIYVQATVNSTSFENKSTLHDNTLTSAIAARLDVSLVLHGQSDPEQLSISVEREDDTRLNFTQTVQLKNTGPSPLPAAEIIILLPENDARATTVFLKRTDIQVTMWQESSMETDVVACHIDRESVLPSGEVVSAVSDKTPRPVTTEPPTGQTIETQPGSLDNQVTDQPLRESGTVLRRTKRAEQKGSSNSAPSGHVLECGAVTCIPVRCRVELLNVGGQAHVNISLSIPEAALRKLKFRSSVLYHTTVSVHPQGGFGFPSPINDNPVTQSINTTFNRSTPPHEEVALWVIIVSAVGASLIFLLIGFILYKCGFFRRKKHAKVEDWKRKSGYSRRSKHASQRSSSISHVTCSPAATGQPSDTKPPASDVD